MKVFSPLEIGAVYSLGGLTDADPCAGTLHNSLHQAAVLCERKDNETIG